MPTDPCGICGGAGRPWRRKHGFAILRCARCGNAYVPTGAIPDNLEDLYSQGYFEGGHGTGYPSYRADRRIIERNFAARARWIRNQDPPGDRLLEIGPAYGFFLRAAEKAGFRASGVEIAADCVAEARSQGLDVVEGDFLSVNLEGSFDVIAMFDVVEHLRDPVACLRRAAQVLSPGGILVIETGDLSTPWARLLGDRWYFLDPPQHLFYFSESGLTQALRRSGFTGAIRRARPGRRVSTANISFKLANGVRDPRLRRGVAALARRGMPPGWLYLNFGDGMLVAAEKK